MAETTDKNSGLSLVLMRNIFYRDHYKRAIVLLLSMLLIDVILLVAVIDRYWNPPEPQYFPVNKHYQFMKWQSLSEPVLTDRQVLSFVANALHEAFSIDYIHWRSELTRASENFTHDGWIHFYNANQTNLNSLHDLKMISSIKLTGSPYILKEGVYGGAYVWNVQVPVLINYVDATKTRSLPPMMATVLVTRVSMDNHGSKHVAISNFLQVAQQNQQSQ